jgi:hypothetical protein
MNAKIMLVPLAVLLAGDATAQDAGKPYTEAQADLLEAAVPLKLQVVFSRYQGETKVGRLPFTLLLNSDNAQARMKVGLMVPLNVRTEGGKGPPTVMFKDVVTGVWCRARSLSGERFALECEFDQDVVYSPDGEGIASAEAAPVIRRFNSQTTLVLQDGQTVQHSATDPLTGEVLEVDVTLTVVK